MFRAIFSHHQERETEIYMAYGILQMWIYRKLCSFVCDVVKISVSRSWWWAKHCPKHVELIL